jgi:hypothetical protein
MPSQALARPTEHLPPILVGRETLAVRKKVEQFYYSIADIFEAWIARRRSPHTQRAYRQDVMSLVEFLGIEWPQESVRLLTISVKDLLAFSAAALLPKS